MPLRLSNERNELRVFDNISGSELVLFYRMPTTRETVAYTNALVRRERNRMVIRQGETRMKYGKRILTGIRDGDFEVPAADGYVPMSSTPGSAHYLPEWKEKIEEHASYLIEHLAVHVFERPSVDDDELSENPDDDAEEPPPHGDHGSASPEDAEGLEKN